MSLLANIERASRVVVFVGFALLLGFSLNEYATVKDLTTQVHLEVNKETALRNRQVVANRVRCDSRSRYITEDIDVWNKLTKLEVMEAGRESDAATYHAARAKELTHHITVLSQIEKIDCSS